MEEPHRTRLGDIGDEDDNASDTPEIVELSEIEHFTAVLQYAQRLAVEAERAKKRTQATHPPGKSERTMRRHKRAQRMLAEKGFLSLPEFVRRTSERENQKAKINAMVAAAMAQQNTSTQPVEEEEEAEAEEEEKSSQHPHGLSDVNGACPPYIHHPSNTRGNWRKGPLILEESEESSEPSNAIGDRDDERSNPSLEVERIHNDAQSIVTQMLEDLRHGNVPDDNSPPTPADTALNLLHDHKALHAAQEQLMAKSNSKDLDAVLRGRILAMIGVLNVFLDEELGYTWTKASVIVAKSQGYGITQARSIQQWVLTFLSTHKLPVNQYGWSQSSVLEDEDISQAIQFALEERGKSGVISATDLVDVIASLEMQERFWQAGINKPSISERTAHCWLGKLGWQYGRHQNSMYIDGHEHEDVVEYRQAFVDRFAKYEQGFPSLG